MSDDPWAREQAAVNQPGAGAGKYTPPGSAQQQNPSTSYGAQPVTEPVITAEGGQQQESFPGFGSSYQGGWLSQGQDASYGAGGPAPMSQAQSERLLEYIVLKQIEDSPPIVQHGFKIVERHTGVRRSQLGLGGQSFLAKRLLASAQRSGVEDLSSRHAFLSFFAFKLLL